MATSWNHFSKPSCTTSWVCVYMCHTHFKYYFLVFAHLGVLLISAKNISNSAYLKVDLISSKGNRGRWGTWWGWRRWRLSGRILLLSKIPAEEWWGRRREVSTFFSGTFPLLPEQIIWWFFLSRWKSSLWKLVWRQLLIYLVIYFSISLLYRFSPLISSSSDVWNFQMRAPPAGQPRVQERRFESGPKEWLCFHIVRFQWPASELYSQSKARGVWWALTSSTTVWKGKYRRKGWSMIPFGSNCLPPISIWYIGGGMAAHRRTFATYLPSGFLCLSRCQTVNITDF